MNKLLKRKSVQLLLLIASTLYTVYVLYDFVGMVRRMHTRAIERDITKAVNQLEKSPAGFQRAEAFVTALKKIDPGYAPVEVKVALTNYILVLDRSINVLKAGQDATLYDSAIEEAKKKLMTSFKNCDGSSISK